VVVAFLRAETDSKSDPLSVRFTANAVNFLQSECLFLAEFVEKVCFIVPQVLLIFLLLLLHHSLS
jgi:hypothetical protein